MRQIASGVWQLSGFPPHNINAYLVDDVLIDAATRWAAPRLLATLAPRPLSLVAVTHCHPDHQGSVGRVCAARKVPLACHEADVDSLEGRRPMLPDTAELR